MKKLIIVALSLIFIFAFVGCSGDNSHVIKITIPAGSTEAFVFSDQEISPTGDTIIISAYAGCHDTAVLLKGIEVKAENTYQPAYLTPGMPIYMDVEKGAWFKIGVAEQNPSAIDMFVTLEVENVEVRIR